MVSWRFFGPGGSIRQLHQRVFETAVANVRAVFLYGWMWVMVVELRGNVADSAAEL